MKKQLRLALLTALIFVVAMMTVFMASATEAPAPGATDNYQVVTSEGVHVDYYATLSEALAGITADGYKIVVLKDVTEATGVKLNIAHTYTITGGTGSKTITFTAAATSSRGTSYTTFLDMTAGAVTLEKLKLASEATPSEHILLNGATALTLDSVEVTGKASVAFAYIKTKAALTVTGSTKLDIDALRTFYSYTTASANTTVTVSGGSFTSTGHFLEMSTTTVIAISKATVDSGSGSLVAFTQNQAKASTVTVGGNVVFETTGSVFKGTKAMDPVSIEINSGFKASGEVLFEFTTSDTKKTPVNVTFNGGELHLVGTQAKLANEATIFADVTYGTNANKDTLKIYFDGGAKTPDAAFDTAFDWSKFSVLFSGFEGSYEIGEGKGGVYNLTSLHSDFYNQIKAELKGQVQVDTTRFPYADVDIAGWIPITVNCADAVLNISGEYDLQDIAFLVKVIAGTVNVDVTCKNAAEPFLILEGGTLNVTGGTYTKKTPFSVSGGTLNITGGTFSGGASLLNLDKAAIVTVSGGTFTGAAMLNITGASTVTVSGGTFTATDAETAFVAVEAAATLNITGGTFVANGAKTLFKLNNADAVLNITGGTFEGAAVTVHALSGSLSMSGGSITVPKDGTGILIDGAATVNITPNAENAENDPVISLLQATYGDSLVKGAIVLTANSDEAALTISGGKLGNVTNVSADSYMYAIYQKGKSTINISGGELYGANSAATIEIYGGSLNITGGTFYGYRNVRLQGSAAALDIKGGTFNSKVGQANNVLIDVSAANAVVSISGGTFNNFTRAIYICVKSTVTVSGGTFNQGTYSGSDTVSTGKNSWIHLTTGATLTIGKLEEGVSEGPVVNLKAQGRFIKLADSANASIVINGGSFIANHADNVLFELGNAASVNTLAINGGTFGIMGEGATLIPRVLDKASVSVTGGAVTIGEGAVLPIYGSFSTAALKVTITGSLNSRLQQILIVAPNTVQQEGEGGVIETVNVPYVFNSVADQIAIIKAYFAEVTLAEGVEANMGLTDWMMTTLNHPEAELHLMNLSVSVTDNFFVRVTAGKLVVHGGSFSASQSGVLFDVQGTATVLLQGGSYTIQDEDARLVSFASGVDTTNVSMVDINLTVGVLGQSPLDITVEKTMDKLVINGLSGITLDRAETYTISSLKDIEEMIRVPLVQAGFVADLKVELTSWVPIRVKHADAIVNITGGEYICTGPYMFEVTAGKLNITGGTFNALGGNLIKLVGAGEVTLAPAQESEINVKVLGAVIYASNAANSSVVVEGGKYVETTPDVTGNQKDALFVYDTRDSSAGATLLIEDGYFEGTRVLLIYYSKAQATINGGTFVSNYVVTKDGPVTSRSLGNQNLLSVRGVDSTLTINGGSFDNKQGYYILAANGEEAGAVITVNNGTFNGGAGWYFTNGDTKLFINGGTFTDADKTAADAYFNIAGAGAMTIGGATCTSGVSSMYIFKITNGSLTVEDGTYTGSLFYVTTKSAIAVQGGTFCATGEKAVMLHAVESSISTTHFAVQNPIDITVADHAYILKGNLSKDTAKALLANVTVTTVGNVRFDCYAAIGVIVINNGDMTPIKNVIKQYIPHITFTDLPVLDNQGNPVSGEYIPSIYGMLFYSSDTSVLIRGEFTWNFAGDTLFYLYNGASMTIEEGTFNIGGGDFIYISGGNGTNLTFGSASDAAKCPVINVTKNGNVFQVAAVKTTITIYNGRFVKDVIDRDHYAGPLFYFADVGGNKTKASTFTIWNGYFEAARILHDYYGKVTTTIWGGTFKSNLVLDKLTDEDYTQAYRDALAAATKENPFVFNAVKHINRSNAYILNVRGYDSYLNIYGGEFDGAYGEAILYSNGGSGATFNFYGGYFTGGYFWFWTNRIVTLNFESWINDGEEISPTFEAKDSFTDHGFDIMRDGEEKGNSNNPKITIKAGTFTMKDLSGRNMWNFGGPTDVKIYGGTFTISPDSTVKDKDRAVYAALFRTDNCTGFVGTTNMDVYGGVFNAASIFYYRYGGGTLNIYAGTFRSNYKSTFVHGNARMLWLAHNDAIFNIYGGNFRANEYTYAIFSTDTADGGTMQLNIYGGTMTGGCRWMQIFKPAIITIDKNPLKDDPAYASYKLHDPKFEELSPISDSTIYGFYIHGNFYGGTLNINYIDIEIDTKSSATAVMVLEGGTINFNPASKNDIKIDIARGRLFQITNAFRAHITINGGNYISRETADMFYITTKMSAVNETNLMNSTFTIEGGNFTCFDNSTMFNVKCEVAEYTIRIKGGNFESDKARTFFLNGYEDSAFGMATSFIVDGGTFKSKSARMIYLDHNAAPLIINGGLFLFEHRESNATGDDAIIYAAGKQKSTVLIQGGTFVDNRKDSDQSIINMNGNADIRLEGDFKLYVLEKKPYFIKNTITPAQSIPMLESNIGEYKNNPYYVCYGYYRQYAPIMVTRPELRTVLGAEGITFTSRISAENAAHLATLGTVTYGTLIFPTASLVGGWQNGTDFLDALIESGSKYKMVEAKNGIVTEDDGSLTIRASLIGIKEKNYTKSFTGIAYAKVTDGNGNETYYWATHISAGVSVTIREVAELAINDTNSAPIVKNGRVYCYVSILKDKTYSRFSSAFQQSLRKYLPASIKPKS